MAEKNTKAVAVTLYPQQVEKLNRLAEDQFYGNVSMAVRRVVDAYPGDGQSGDVVWGWLQGRFTAEEAMQALAGQLPLPLAAG